MNFNYTYIFLIILISNSYLYAGPGKRVLNFNMLGKLNKGFKASNPPSESVLKARAEFLKEKKILLKESYPNDLIVFKGGLPHYEETFKSGFTTKNQSKERTDVEEHRRGGTHNSTWFSTSVDESAASAFGSAVYKIRIPRERLLKDDLSIVDSTLRTKGRISEEDGSYHEKEVSIAHKISRKDIVEVKIDGKVIKNPNFDPKSTGDKDESKSSTILKKFLFGEGTN
mgnify:CR=1 FL=1